MWKIVMRTAVLSLAALLVVVTLGVTGDAATGPVVTFGSGFTGWRVNTDEWVAQDTSFSGMSDANRDCIVNNPQVISQWGGSVHLSARRTSTPFVCRSPYGNWSTRYAASTIATRGHFSQAYGRFEFRARMPATTAPGLHAALWLYPAKNTYGAWPASGEIDVAEWFSNRPSIALNALHYTGNTGNVGIACRTATPSSFHTYAVQWAKGVATFSIDGHDCWSHAWKAPSVLPGLAPFDKPFYFVLSMGFGAGDNAPTAATPATATMDVDWVRATSAP
ncbi:glycoside hydrolase family 16 protein [Nocardioides montaniterrae]